MICIRLRKAVLIGDGENCVYTTELNILCVGDAVCQGFCRALNLHAMGLIQFGDTMKELMIGGCNRCVHVVPK